MNMNKSFFDLTGKVIVITGACGLLGRNHALAVASANGIPVLLDLKKNKLDSLVKEINCKFSVHSIGLKVDITSEKQVKDSCKKIISKFGRVDSLINNAANNPKMENKNKKNFSRIENFNIKQWNNDISVGLTGAFLCAKYFGYEMSKNKSGGVIINISSDLGLVAPDQRLYQKIKTSKLKQPVKPITYSVIKSGIIGLTRYLSTYWNQENIRCNVLCPGPIENNQPEIFLKKLRLKIPLGRLAKENEYQSTLIWMLSDETSYLNGAIIPVDGGRSVW